MNERLERWAAAAICCGCGVMVAGCTHEGPTSIVVDLRTDYVPGVEFVRVQSTLGETASIEDTFDARVGNDFFGGQRVAELEVGAQGGMVLDVALIDAAGALASRRTHVTVEPGVNIVTVVIARRDVGPCATDADCTTDAPCAEGRCTLDTCLQTPIAGACPEDSYCSIDERACRPLPDVPPVPTGCTSSAECAMGSVCHERSCVQATAFRTTRLTLLDPHFFAEASAAMCYCVDATSLINDRVNDEIAAVRRNLTYVFLPLDPSAGRNTLMAHGDADCTSETSCGPSGQDPQPGQGTHTTSGTTSCSTAAPETLGGYEALPAPAPPCFVSDPMAFGLSLDGASDLDFAEVRVAATLPATSPDRVVDGLMAAFVTEDSARAALLPPDVETELCGEPTVHAMLKGGGSCRGGDDRDDLDGDGAPDGWWFYFSFDAQRVDWSEPE